MGWTQAMGMAGAVLEGQIDLDTALHYHLRANHYPPVPASMIPTCKAAIQAVNEGENTLLIDLPTGVFYRDEPQAPAFVIVEEHHLDPFLDNDES